MTQSGDGTLTKSLSAAFEREHHAIDEGIQAFADGLNQDNRRRLVDALHALRRHIYAEEELMFPPLREAGLVGPILVMLREHAQMWQLLDALDHLLATDDADRDTLRATCADLFDLLQQHNPKEETILYPQADEVLTDADVARLTMFLSSGDLPGGWSCQNLRGSAHRSL